MDSDLNPETQYNRRRRLIGLGLVSTIVAAFVIIASQTSPWRLAELKVFDYFSTVAPPPLSSASPVIVAIDESSLAEIGERWPWPRDLHAKLIAALRDAGAKAIGLDIIFAEPSDPVADASLASTMGPDIVLAADETTIRTPNADQHISVQPLAALTDAGAMPGVASVSIDGDGVVRRLPSYPDGFAARLLEPLGRDPSNAIASGGLLRTAGPARTFETVSYYQALDPAAFLPKGIFRDRVVIVGLSTQSSAGIDEPGADLYATSYTVRSKRLLSGAELQATIFENLARNQLVVPVSTLWNSLIIVTSSAFAAFAVWRGTGRVSGALTIFAILCFFAVSLLGVWKSNVFIAPLAPSLAFAGVAGIQSARDYAAERRRRLRIIRAFSQYLSPVLVARLAEGSAPLRLGGERRTLTVLFCDVRGFTTISEEMKDDPEGLTSLMNRLLNPLSDVILRSGGTIDKYIGDAIMAFWNAPLEDPDHAYHAVEAALGMLEAVGELNAAREAESVGSGTRPQPLRIGIGINTGECVVGNLGSEFRFNYSALGDAVNVASRLESETKAMGVAILVGEETMRALGGGMKFAELGLIKVNGKSQAMTVGTPVTAGAIAALSEHDRLVKDLHAQRLRADDPRFVVLERDLPQLAGFYRNHANRLQR